MSPTPYISVKMGRTGRNGNGSRVVEFYSNITGEKLMSMSPISAEDFAEAIYDAIDEIEDDRAAVQARRDIRAVATSLDTSSRVQRAKSRIAKVAQEHMHIQGLFSHADGA